MELLRLGPRARTLFYLRSFLGLGLFWLPGVVVGGVALAAVLPVWAAVAVASTGVLLLGIEALWMPYLEHRRWGYGMDDHALRVERGVILRRVTAIPLGRIQHVDTKQGPLEQAFGLCRLQVYTASGMGADASVPGLETAEAERVRELLMARVQEADVDDGV